MLEIINKSRSESFLNSNSIKDFFIKVCSEFGKELIEVNVILLNDGEMLSLNKSKLNHDYRTDVITDDWCVDNQIISDIYLNLDMIKENSKERGISGGHETIRVLSHGLLHLFGFKDKTEREKREMRLQEDRLIKVYEDMFHVEL